MWHVCSKTLAPCLLRAQSTPQAQAACSSAAEAAAREPAAAEPDQTASQAAAEGSVPHPEGAGNPQWWLGGPLPLECLPAFRDEVGARPHPMDALDRVSGPPPLADGLLGRSGRPPSHDSCTESLCRRCIMPELHRACMSAMPGSSA